MPPPPPRPTLMSHLHHEGGGIDNDIKKFLALWKSRFSHALERKKFPPLCCAFPFLAPDPEWIVVKTGLRLFEGGEVLQNTGKRE